MQAARAVEAGGATVQPKVVRRTPWYRSRRSPDSQRALGDDADVGFDGPRGSCSPSCGQVNVLRACRLWVDGEIPGPR